MKWFKHFANAGNDVKLRRLKMKYGMDGYGLYWHILEQIASTVEMNRLTFELEHDSEIIALDTGIHYERVQEMMAYMVELGLFTAESGMITCLKMRDICDEYIAKIIRGLPNVPTHSGHTPEKVPSIREDKIRTDKNRTEDRRARKRAPKDFQVSVQMYEWAESDLGLSAETVQQETAAFQDHEFKTAKKDWPAVWRNWMRRSAQWQKDNPGKKLTYAQQLAQDLANANG